ncbi:hypothetical protein P3T22_001557 [Paraburkholderia sp. GAS348]|jgi:hypothetical protein
MRSSVSKATFVAVALLLGHVVLPAELAGCTKKGCRHSVINDCN